MIVINKYNWFMLGGLLGLILLAACKHQNTNEAYKHTVKNDSIAYADSISNLELVKQQQIAKSPDSSNRTSAPMKNKPIK